MGIDDIFIGFVISYIAGNIPSLKSVFSKRDNKPLQEHVDECYSESLKRWTAGDTVRERIAQKKLTDVSQVREMFKNDEWEKAGVVLNAIAKFWADELRKDEDCAHYIETQAICDTRERIEGLVSLLKKHDGFQNIKQIRRGLTRHKPVEGYIRRYCSSEKLENDYFSYLLGSKYRHTLADFVTGLEKSDKNKFILYSSAQTGKTTELEQLCWELQQSELYLPVSFEVRNNTKLKREDLPVFQYLGDKEVVVVIDALDEVNGQKYEDLIEEIGGYAYDHPEMKIVLSCRSNYRRESRLNQFAELFLEELSGNDAQAYIDEVLGKANGKKLASFVIKYQLVDFIKNPFFLNVLIDSYKADCKNLPKTKAEIYRIFIERSYREEKSEKTVSTRFQHSFEESVQLHERIALGMSLMNVQTLSKKELLFCLHNNDNNLEECLRYDLIHREENERYSFKHNAFREWLVAHYLSHEGLGKAKLFATHPNGRIKPEWYNIIMLWVSMYGEDKKKEIDAILEWLKGASLELVIYIDKGMLSEDVRNSVFKGLLLEYKSLGIRMSNIMTQDYKNLLSFGLSDDTADFVASEIMDTPIGTAYYADLMCLCYFMEWNKLEIKNPDLTEKLFTALLVKTEEALMKKDSNYLEFLYFDNEFFSNERYLVRIYDTIKDSNHHEAIRSMIRLIDMANRVDEFVDYILNKEQYVHNQQEGSTTHIVSRTCIYATLSKVKSLSSIKKIMLHQFYDSRIAYYDEHDGQEKMISSVLKLSSEYIKRGDDELAGILESYYERLFKDYYYYFDHNNKSHTLIEKFRKCYCAAGLRERGRRIFYSSVSELFKSHDRRNTQWDAIRSTFNKAALWMTEDDLKDDFREFSTTDGSDLAKASWYREIPYKPLAETAKKLFDEKYPQLYNYTKGMDRRRKSFADFADYSVFKEIVLEMVSGLDSHITRKEYGKKIRNLENGYNQYAYRFLLYHPLGEENYDIEGVVRNIKDKDTYDAFFMKEISGMMEHPDPDLLITEDIRERCNSIAKSIVLKICNKQYPVFFQQDALALMLKGCFEIPSEELPLLLDYGGVNIAKKDEDGYLNREYSVFDYITERVEEQVLAPLVVEKLGQYVDKECYNRTYQFANYIIDRGVEEGYGLALQYALSGYYMSANVLESIIKSGIMIDEIMAATSMMKASDRLFCYSSLARNAGQEEWVKKKMEAEFKSFDDYDLKRALQQLLSLGSMDALDYLISHTELVIDGDDYHFNYDNPNAVPSLCFFIGHYYEHKLDGHFMLSSILNSLEKIAIKSQDSLMEVKRYLGLLTQKNERLKYLNRYIISFEDKFYASNQGIGDITVAMKKVDDVDNKNMQAGERVEMTEINEDDCIYVSYNWESASKNIVEFLCFVLETNKIPFKRDKKDCHYLDNIKEFMDTIRNGRTVIVVFSRPYLRSKNCMYELSGVMEDASYIERILPVVVDDGIRDPMFYVDLAEYWKGQRDSQYELVERLSAIDPVLASPEEDNLKEIEAIYSFLPVIKRYIDWTNVENLDYMSATRFSTILRKIRERAKCVD